MLYAPRCLKCAAFLCKSMDVRFIMGEYKGTFGECFMIDIKTVGGIVTLDEKKKMRQSWL